MIESCSGHADVLGWVGGLQGLETVGFLQKGVKPQATVVF